jgi:DNA-binding response OmpR family regulator
MEHSEGPAPFSAPTRPSSLLATVRIAILDSDGGFARVLAKRMTTIGWRVETLASLPSSQQLSQMRLQAIVIDPALAADQAWTYLEQLCIAGAAPSVIVCSGPSTVAQRVRGLRLGVDDWVTKPCHPEEVLARIEVAIRRRRRMPESEAGAAPIVAGEMEIRPDMFEAFVGGQRLGLTRREFELLALLAGSSGTVVPRETIYERIWGYSMVHGDRSVDVFVRKLRRKLEDASPGWHYLHTHFGVGYRFEPVEVDLDSSS